MEEPRNLEESKGEKMNRINASDRYYCKNCGRFAGTIRKNGTCFHCGEGPVRDTIKKCWVKAKRK
jgi:hypothetical protein